MFIRHFSVQNYEHGKRAKDAPKSFYDSSLLNAELHLTPKNPLLNRILATLISVALVAAMVPSQALADDNSSVESTISTEKSETLSGQPTEADDLVQSGEHSDNSKLSEVEEASSSVFGTSTEENNNNSFETSTNDYDLAESLESTNNEDEGDAQLSAKAAAKLDSKSVICVSSTKNPVRFSNYSGFVKSNVTLYVSAWTSRGASKISSEGFTYQWYASDAANASASDMSKFELLKGQTSSSIVLDDKTRKELDGKCLRVSVTSGDITVYGPSASAYSNKVSAVKRIDAPVPEKTALDDKSYILIQGSTTTTSPTSVVKAGVLRPGSVLCANAYDSEAVPSARISSQERWKYEWLACDNRDADDSEFSKIPNQSSQTLTITDDLAAELAGKYIRVKVVGDGQELYGPSGSFDRPASVKYNTPGPVATSGQIGVGHIVLAYNGEEFGNQYEDIPNASVGDVIRAAAYYLDYDTPSDLYGEDKVNFSWQIADTEKGEYREVATGSTFTVGEYAGKYLKVVATAKNGIVGCSTHETEPGRILAKGASTLFYVDYINASKGAVDTGTTIEAVAYKGDYWESEPVTNGVTFTWRWSDKNPSSSEFQESDWHVVSGETQGSFTIPADFANRWINVVAYAGDNTVEADSSVAVKAAGSHELSNLVYIKKIAGDLDSKYTYSTGEKIGIEAYELTSAGTKGDRLTSDQLSLKWQISDTKGGVFSDITDENVNRSSLVIPESYEGKYLRCLVFAGYNTQIASINKPIAKGEGFPSYSISSIDVEKDTNLIQVGSTLKPTIKTILTGESGEYEALLPQDAIATYVWYAADDENHSNAFELSGVDDSNGSIKLPSEVEGKYVYLVANAGVEDKQSDSYYVGPSEEKTITVNVKITGVTNHKKGESFSDETWVPLTEFSWKSTEKRSAWDAFSSTLLNAGYTFSTDGGVPYSITTPDKTRTLKMSDSAPWSYWAFVIDGEYSSVMPTGYLPSGGETIELVYVDASGSYVPSKQPSVNKNAPHPEVDVQWSGFSSNGAGAVTSGNAPEEKTDPKWTRSLLTSEEQAKGASCTSSDPLIINGKIYIVSCATTYSKKRSVTTSLARLQVVNPDTGIVENKIELGASMDSTCRPVVSNGIIVIPLSGGVMQAVSASTLETIWFNNLDSGQNISTLTVDGEYVYYATADAFGQGYTASSGTLRRINLLTGALAGEYSNHEAGYYWSGGLKVGDYYLVGDDAGNVSALNADLSEVISNVRLSTKGIRSSLLSYQGSIYAVSADGVLHCLSFSDDGVLTEVNAIKFADSSTSTPSFFGGTAYVGGCEGGKGVLAAINLSDFAVTKVTQVDGEDLTADSKSTPLVVKNGDSVLVYFTLNGDVKGSYPNSSGGGVYVYKLGNSQASKLYEPTGELANYCMASVISDGNGNLFYTNDSGNLFRLSKAIQNQEDNTPGDGSLPDSQNPSLNNGLTSGQNQKQYVSVNPLKPSPLINSESSADSASSNSQDNSKATPAKEKSSAPSVSSSSSAAKNSNQNKETNENNPVWPYVALIIGICALACVLWFVLAGRKRKNK